MPGAMNVRQKLAKGRPLKGHPNKAPTISSISGSTNPVQNVPTQYIASAFDAEERNISDRIVWTIPGGKKLPDVVLGRGGNVLLTFDTLGSDTLTATITDSFGASDDSSLGITVVAPAGSP